MLLLSISFIETLPFKCGTDSLEDNYINLNFIEINNKRRLQDEYRPIEIHFDFSNLKILPDIIFERSKRLLNEAVSEFKKFLKVKQTEYKVDIPLEEIKQNCSLKESEEIPENFFNTHDIIIYPLINFYLKGETLAGANVCVYQNNKIPRIGYIMFNPFFLYSQEGADYSSFMNISPIPNPQSPYIPINNCNMKYKIK